MMRVTGSLRGTGVVFTGDGGIGVKEFLWWMESWFATQGENFNGESVPSKRRRVAQIHVSCPIRSVAGNFLRTLPTEVLWDEEALTRALIAQFQDGETDGQEQEDILSTMSTLHQGDHDVFTYSRRVLRLLRRHPGGLQHYDKILIRYYLDGLASQRLRELTILSFLKPDSGETPYQVVKGVMLLAKQLRVKGYRKAGGRNGDNDTSDDDDDDDYELTSFYDSSSDSEPEADGYRMSGRRKEKENRSAKSRRTRKRQERGSQSRERKGHKGHDSGESVKGEVQELREMMRDLMKIQKAVAAPGTRGSTNRQEDDIISLDTYAVTSGYERYPQSTKQAYEQRNTHHPTAWRPEYRNRRSHTLQAADYNQGYRGDYHSFSDNRRQETGYVRPPFRTSFGEPTRRPTESTHIAQQMSLPPEQYHTRRTYEGSSALPPIISPNGTLYYPARPRICFHCQEEGHLRPQCPRLHNPSLRTVTVGPEHPDTRRESAPTGSRSRSVSVVEVAAKSSALNGMRVCEVTAAGEDLVDLKKFVCKVEASEKGGNSSSDYSDNQEDGIPVMAGEKA